jgi:hypothetical protein
MIVFDLICCDQHRFEGWFASGEEFERQRSAGLISCPACATDRIEKLPTAKIGRMVSASTPASPPAVAPEKEKIDDRREAGPALAAFIDHVLQNTEDVGRAFPSEARKIDRGLVPRRGIRGTASREEAEELSEEGISVVWLPIPPRDEWQ